MDLFVKPSDGFSVEELIPDDKSDFASSAKLYRSVFDDEQCRTLFNNLAHSIAWEQREITLFGKRHLQPRLIAWYGDGGASYTYSGLKLRPRPWVVPLMEIKTACEAVAGARFNGVLLNQYRDGNDAMGWHSDNETELGTNPTIASVSFGASRRFDLRHKRTKETIRSWLPNGSILVMSGQTQTDWVHQVPRTKKVGDARINLTFRWVHA
ncbi:2OG-Fe(II) oxygenase superfamily protein [Luminiphilus syltensis NOR5-1B]|uniref:2OG-Fe(II) oxygenase superfamily protein n=1 Tax=Luminiphilus syltensis NOR5-1B TaxID=565045 RepID=B8KWS1_9GAMM|nr:alpha-ketoglutarate-dependent dioxygenase AlkB [Luminiphilus syltensis]EED36361.1 2OG-Fe(II) oxygenase superfamily protein [Luminiphilus syltensis NOR5-1B]